MIFYFGSRYKDDSSTSVLVPCPRARRGKTPASSSPPPEARKCQGLWFRNRDGELTDGLLFAGQKEKRGSRVEGGTQRASAWHPVDVPPLQRPSADKDKEYLLCALADVVRPL